MLKNTIIAIAVVTGLFAANSEAADALTNLPPYTITVSAFIDKKDIVVVRGDKLWFTHLDGEFPRNVKINHKPWTQIHWGKDQKSDRFTMNNPRRLLPRDSHKNLISVSLAQTNAVIDVIGYPEMSNGWTLMVVLDNSESESPTQMDVTISWTKRSPGPIAPSRYVTPATTPSPTPVGLR